MAKTRKHTRSRSKHTRSKHTSKKSMKSEIDKEITKIGSTAKYVVKNTEPVLESGVSAVYTAMSSGLDLGAKGAKIMSQKIAKNNRNRSASSAGGRRHKHYRRTRKFWK